MILLECDGRRWSGIIWPWDGTRGLLLGLEFLIKGRNTLAEWATVSVLRRALLLASFSRRDWRVRGVEVTINPPFSANNKNEYLVCQLLPIFKFFRSVTPGSYLYCLGFVNHLAFSIFRAIILQTQTFVLPIYCIVLYSLYSLLNVSALNLGHSQEAAHNSLRIGEIQGRNM